MIVVAIQALGLPLVFTFILTGMATIDFSASSGSASSAGPSGFGTAMIIIGGLIATPLQFTGLIAVVLLVMWTYRSAQSGATLGIPAQRSPGWAIGGWFIPIVSLWFPYESIRDALPADRRPNVLRWWLLYLATTITPVFAILVIVPFVFTGLAPLVLLVGLLATVGLGVLAFLQLRSGFRVADHIHHGQCALARETNRLTS